MTDAELIDMLRNNVGVSEAACRAAKAAADRIEQLIIEKYAATAAAYEVAAKAVTEARVFADDDTDGETAAKVIALGRATKAIRALATPDQTAAMDAVRAEARAQGMREAAEYMQRYSHTHMTVNEILAAIKGAKA